ncbi:hypothetical protein J2Z69_000033 [Paenibacillus shirakamiensis]|uniref:General stress protein 17M-like domain-containing protein n=1 Tax=Paenibacillus shirakamiensis TaxID=1265935 RepID=A0ABS4JBC6_9BACL|nr:hypothetical protein [Paenibacillus shirakamiensis]MBP1999014.1 hypothetical protein [Paenibacillus shirakamiensis]
MSKHIQAYFQTESQAEGARTSLLSFETDNLEVGRLDHEITRGNQILDPVDPDTASSPIIGGGVFGAAGLTGTTAPQTVVPFVTTNNDTVDHAEANYEGVDRERDVHQQDRREDSVVKQSGSTEDLKYVLSAKVKDEEVDDIVQKLRENGAHVEVLS